MTIEEVLRINHVLLKSPVLKDDPLVTLALTVNTAALIRLNLMRSYNIPMALGRLKGETFE